MLTWALVNVVLTVLALVFAVMNSGAPHRLRFHACVLALLGWLVPWSQVGGWLPDRVSLDLWQLEQQLIASSASATELPLIIIDTRAVPLASDVTLLHLPLMALAALLLSGVTLYLWSLLQHQLRLLQLRQVASDGSHLLHAAGITTCVPVLLQPRINGAFSSGIWRPVVWVHADLATSAELPTLLRHELVHIEQHDNAWLLVITLVEKLLWWNPLVRYLGQQARQLQELSCDERCRAANADYPAQLAQLMLTNLGISRSRASEPLLLSANIFNKPNINIQRLKVLQRSHQMKPRHIASCIATAALAVATVGLVTAQPPSPPAVPGERTMIFVAGDAATGAAGIPAGEPHMVFGVQGADGTNQMLKVTHNGTDMQVSFNFTDAALPMVLGPLANMLGAPPLAPEGEAIVRKVIRTGAGTADGQGNVVLAAPAGVTQFELGDEVAAGAGNGEPQRVIRRVQTAGAAAAIALPPSPNLVIEDEAARERQVTVQGENLSLADAIAAIAKASNCNIFKDGEQIVVDYCGQ